MSMETWGDPEFKVHNDFFVYSKRTLGACNNCGSNTACKSRNATCPIISKWVHEEFKTQEDAEKGMRSYVVNMMQGKYSGIVLDYAMEFLNTVNWRKLSSVYVE